LLEGLALRVRRAVMWPLLIPTAIPVAAILFKKGGENESRGASCQKKESSIKFKVRFSPHWPDKIHAKR
jgi:hypothetical protein